MTAAQYAPDSRRSTPVVVGLALVAAAVAAVLYVMDHTAYDVWGGLLVAPVLIVATIPLARSSAKALDDPLMTRIIIGAAILKLLSSLVRYAVAFELYDRADAALYVEWGTQLAPLFRDGFFIVDVQRPVPGTGAVRYITGLVFAVIGPTTLGGFLVFSWFGFLGMWWFHRAFALALPHSDHRRYSLLLFFLPSLLFWPSSVGKEAWMMGALGLAAFGAARVFARLPWGFLVAALGVAGAALVRPHMGALFCAALVAAYLFRPHRKGMFGPLAKILGMVILLAGMLLVLKQVERFFGVEETATVEAAEAVLAHAEEQSSQGGSAFEAPRPSSPVEFPLAAVTVMFRPLPHEAHNAQALVASFEGLVLLGMFAFAVGRWRRTPLWVWKNPYVILSLVYSTLFVVAFSSFGNFGILTRQRVQLFPFALILLALPYTSRTSPARRAHNHRVSV